MAEKTIQQMSDAEIVGLMRGESLLNRVRKIFYSGMAEIEQADQQRNRPAMIDVRKMEFLIAQRVIKEVQDATPDDGRNKPHGFDDAEQGMKP